MRPRLSTRGQRPHQHRFIRSAAYAFTHNDADENTYTCSDGNCHGDAYAYTDADSESTPIPVLGAPTATKATNLTAGSFIANWSRVSGATGYRLGCVHEQLF
jgi:hypothetical protein